jgi:hypothetical protein
MGRLLLAAAVVGGVLGSASAGPLDRETRFEPHTTSVTWPSVTPPGWYTNTYSYRWYYPWYAYYDYTHGPYANWMAGGGCAGYANHGPAGMYYSSKPPAQPYIGEWYYRTQAQQGMLGTPTIVPGGHPGAYNSLKDMTDKSCQPGEKPKEKDKK